MALDGSVVTEQVSPWTNGALGIAIIALRWCLGTCWALHVNGVPWDYMKDHGD